MKRCKLGDLFKIKQGFAFKTTNYVEISPYRLVTLGNFTGDNKFKYNDAKATYYQGVFPDDVILKEGDLIIPLTEQVEGLFGNSAFIPKTNGNYTFVLNQRVGKLLYDDKKINKYYLHYLLATKKVREQIEARASGTQQRNVSPDSIYDVIVDILDYKEQEKIGKLLYDIEHKIVHNETTNFELESIAKTIYDYWFLQFEFPNEEGKPYKSSGGKMVWNDELKREIPEGWKFGQIENIVSSIECGDRPAGGAEKSGIPSIGAEKIESVGIYDFANEKYISENYYNQMRKGKVKSWDILLYKDGAGVGKVTMVGDNFPYKKCAVNSHVFILRSEDNFYQNFLYGLLSKEYMRKIMISLAAKAAQPGLNQPAVMSLPTLIPSNDVLEKYNNICNSLYHTAFSKAKENYQLSSLRDFLLPMLMNGQVTFKEKDVQ